ncbi:MAG: LamB/YcsF family protein, partial [Fimbriimonadaceae bacterium]|nr:LamB/YcsF family protein [Fimbriimonadaceae bacterium]
GLAVDADLLPLISTANISLGGHAGSEDLARETAARCRARGIRVALHPGYPDRESFGRTSRDLGDEGEAGRMLTSLSEQCGIILGAQALKPHGAFYHDSDSSSAGAGLLSALLLRFPVPLIGSPVGLHRTAAGAAAVRFLSEGFVDRRYRHDGRLVPRSREDALLTEEKEIRDQALRLAESCDTLCLHSDTPNAVEIARLVRAALSEAGWDVGA